MKCLSKVRAKSGIHLMQKNNISTQESKMVRSSIATEQQGEGNQLSRVKRGKVSEGKFLGKKSYVKGLIE